MEGLLFNEFSIHTEKIAINVGGITTNYSQLDQQIIAYAQNLLPKELVAICNQSPCEIVRHISAYVACLRSGACAMMLVENQPTQEIYDSFMPDTVFSVNACVSANFRSLDCKPALLLSTSGSTSTRKFVKLTKQNIIANCDAIINSLPIRHDDVTCLLLSPTYSYGLSIVNTHLRIGATIYVPTTNVLSRLLWKEINSARITSIGFVPSHLDVLSEQKFEFLIPKTLRYITVAGGRITEKGRQALERFRALGVETYVMYGQTEATARLTCLPDSEFSKRLGSVGKAIDGRLTIDENDEILYSGPNVFTGYASSRDDLSEAKSIDILRTGDLGKLIDGYLWVTGRLKRIAKINSTRVSLDELERQLETTTNAVKCISDDEWIYAFATVQIDPNRVSPFIRSKIRYIHVDSVPLLNNGKTDYSSLENRVKSL
jgi:acyl-CoA synthetase (AMP-forming)/AMP-acid ligase II